MTYIVYILKSSSTGNYYVDQTENIHKRLIAHNSGKVKSTKGKIPWFIIWTENFETRKEAIKRESQIKSWKSRSQIEKLVFGSVPKNQNSKNS